MSKPKIQSAKVLYSKGGNDDCLTPEYAVTPLLEFIPRGVTIWCPFDTAQSAYVRVLSQHGFNVVYSHIDNGQDFLCYEPVNGRERVRWDMIISNGPFTGKRQIFERALSFGKPFAILMTNTWLNDSAPKQLFADKDLQLLMFDKRIQFENQIQKGITFSSSYFCWNFLPKQMMMRKLNIPKKGK